MIELRGRPVQDLIGSASLPSMIWLLVRGSLPAPGEAALLEAALVASVDHGPQAPSIAAARMAVTCGVGLNTAIAGDYLRAALAVEEALNKGRSQPVPMNIDGATAVIYAELAAAHARQPASYDEGGEPGRGGHGHQLGRRGLEQGEVFQADRALHTATPH